MTELALTLLAAPLAAFTVTAALLEAAASDLRHARARELAGRAAGRLGLAAPGGAGRIPLALELPATDDRPAATLRYHLAAPQEEDARITLVAVAAAQGNRLGSLWIDSDPTRLGVPGLVRLPLGPAYDRHFRVYGEADRLPGLASLLAQHDEVALLLRRLATRSRSCRLELVHWGGVLKVEVRDHRLRFPSDVEAVSLDLVALHAALGALAPARTAR